MGASTSPDPNALHTFSASGTITITVKRMSQRTARRRIRDFRARPRNHPV